MRISRRMALAGIVSAPLYNREWDRGTGESFPSTHTCRLPRHDLTETFGGNRHRFSVRSARHRKKRRSLNQRPTQDLVSK